MSTQTFHLPDVGEGLTEAEIVQWRVAPGDTVEVNDVLVEIETAKSLVELPSPFAGTVGELLAPEGDTVTVGAAIITIAEPATTAVSSVLETARSADVPITVVTVEVLSVGSGSVVGDVTVAVFATWDTPAGTVLATVTA